MTYAVITVVQSHYHILSGIIMQRSFLGVKGCYILLCYPPPYLPYTLYTLHYRYINNYHVIPMTPYLVAIVAPWAYATISPSTMICPQKLTRLASKDRRNWMKGEFCERLSLYVYSMAVPCYYRNAYLPVTGHCQVATRCWRKRVRSHVTATPPTHTNRSTWKL